MPSSHAYVCICVDFEQVEFLLFLIHQISFPVGTNIVRFNSFLLLFEDDDSYWINCLDVSCHLSYDWKTKPTCLSSLVTRLWSLIFTLFKQAILEGRHLLVVDWWSYVVVIKWLEFVGHTLIPSMKTWAPESTPQGLIFVLSCVFFFIKLPSQTMVHEYSVVPWTSFFFFFFFWGQRKCYQL